MSCGAGSAAGIPFAGALAVLARALTGLLATPVELTARGARVQARGGLRLTVDLARFGGARCSNAPRCVANRLRHAHAAGVHAWHGRNRARVVARRHRALLLVTHAGLLWWWALVGAAAACHAGNR